MTAPLIILAFFSILLGFFGTPAWPWFQSFLGHEPLVTDFGRLGSADFLSTVLVSTAVVFCGLGLGYWFYGRGAVPSATQPDVLETLWPNVFVLLRRKYFVDEAYEATVIRFTAFWARACAWLDDWIWEGIVQLLSFATVGLAWVNRSIDEFVINLGFDKTCKEFSRGGGLMARVQDGRVQHYLRLIGVGLTVLILLLVWGCAR